MVLGDWMKEIIVAGATVIENKKLLVILDEQVYYKTPGGKREKNESHKEIVKREAMEEVGIEVEVGELLNEHFIDRGEKKYHLFNYRAYRKSKPKITSEIKGFKWLSYEDSKKEKLSSNVQQLVNFLHVKGEM